MMAPGMRLYVLDLGSIVLHPSCAMSARPANGEYRIPVPAFLVTHPAGNVLYDTGMDPTTINDPIAVWGPLMDQLTPDMKPQDHIVKRLAAIGFSPRDISYVILSHLHSDHAGGICLFPDAEFILQRAELESTVTDGANLFYPEPYRVARLDQTLAECVRSVRLLDGDEDLFGDGHIVALSTPGHVPGHQSLLVRLDHIGDVLIAGDAGSDSGQLEDMVIPGGTWRPDLLRRSFARLRDLRDKSALTIYGHDPDLWPTLKHSPEYYD